MTGRRILYLMLLVGCMILQFIFRSRLCSSLLLWLLCLPVISLFLSIPAMTKTKFRLCVPQRAAQQERLEPMLHVVHCPYPLPPVRGKLQVTRHITGETVILDIFGKLRTSHCGVRTVRVSKLWIYDYLGLFRRQVRNVNSGTLLVKPTPVAIPKLPRLQPYREDIWQPKPGASRENHELRQYRPGDDLRGIHWKLAAKTGSLIFQEPVQPHQIKVVVTVKLWGDEDRIDLCAGRLLWLSRYLLEREIPHTVRYLTAEGLHSAHIASEDMLDSLMVSILSTQAAREAPLLPPVEDAGWQYEIGGDTHEG